METHNHYYYSGSDQQSSNPLYPDLDFFRKHANIYPRKLRRVTTTQVMLQAAQMELSQEQIKLNNQLSWNYNRPIKTLKSKKSTVNKKSTGATATKKQSRSKAVKARQDSADSQGGPTSQRMDVAELKSIVNDYENLLQDKYGITLLASCPCPGDVTKYCPWDESMLQDLINEHAYWTIISAQIIRISDGQLLSTTSPNNIITSPSNRFSLLKFIHLQPMSVGDKVLFVINWIDEHYNPITTSVRIQIA